MKYGAFWGNDDIKVTSNLNITLGLRFDWQGDLHEEYGRFSTFDPNAPNPVRRPRRDDLPQLQGKWEIQLERWSAHRICLLVQSEDGHSRRLRNVLCRRAGRFLGPLPCGWLPNESHSCQLHKWTAPGLLFQRTNPASSAGCVTEQALGSFVWLASGVSLLPPQLRPDVANGANPVGVDPRTYTMPRYQNWSLSFQRQLSRNMGIDIAYVGNHGTRLVDGRTSAGVYDNMNPASVLSLGRSRS